MSWLPHGSTATGLLHAAGGCRSRSVPAVATHRGRLWCLWADLADGAVWYAVTDNDGEFAPRQAFPEGAGPGLPVAANLNGILHAVVVRDGTGTMAHYVYDDEEAEAWVYLGEAGGDEAGVVTHSTPGLVAFHNKLFLVFLRDGRLYCAIWLANKNGDAGAWSAPEAVAGPDRAFRGIPALFVLDGALHVLCSVVVGDGRDDNRREIAGYRYNYIARTWSECDDVTEGRAASGVSAASYGDSAYLGFIEAGPGDEAHAVYVAAYSGGAWQPEEAVGAAAPDTDPSADGDQPETKVVTAADPPQIAILNGRVHCIFNDDTPTRDLRWYSRPVLAYALSSWMARLPDGAPLSALTVPGTHDSCARSNIPFVRTQYLSVAQQLALGLRFLDLRLRRHEDENDKLYCYHGGIPIDLPRYLAFDAVMAEVWAFLDTHPSEVVLVSINDDDTSAAQRADPAPFYNAVAAAIAATPPYNSDDGGALRHRWFAEPVTPTLGEVRGRAVLLRRYAGDPAVPPAARQGLDLSGWVDDDPDFTIVTPTSVRVRLQDKWKYAERIALHDLVASKSAFVRGLMERAAASASLESSDEDEDRDAWFVNFCSAVGDPAEHGEVAEAKWIAVGAHSDLVGRWVEGMNVRTRDYLRQGGARRRRLGVVNLDYPELPEDSDLVARLIETNF